METTLKEHLRRVSLIRERFAKLKSELATKKKTFEEENADLYTGIAETAELVSLEESALRTEALKVYEATGQKKLDNGIGIRVKTVLEYRPDEALAWAKAHDLALTLNQKAFEALAKTQDIAFVKKLEKAEATIPVNISFE